MDNTTSTQFLEWRMFFEMERNRITKQDYYLAQIAVECRKGWVKKPNDVKLKDLFFKFKTRRQARDEKKKSKTAMATKLQQSKSFWMATAGIPKES